MNAAPMAVRAPAKLNLHLQVLELRDDGYHELRTLFQSIDLTDEVRASPRSDGQIVLRVVPDDVVAAGESNLVLRAANALREWAGVSAGAQLELIKRIPVGAGLGGGSADAAATLVLLDALWALDLGPEALGEIAAGIGADVPFFLCGGTALGIGRGDELHPLPDLENYAVVVCLPQLEVPTAEVFSQFDCRLTSEVLDATVYAFVAGRMEAGKERPPWERFFNDLEPVVIARWPEIDRVLQALRATRPLHSAVTGSGAAVFAVYSGTEAALRAVVDLDDRWRIHVGSMLGRADSKLVARPVVSREEDRE